MSRIDIDRSDHVEQPELLVPPGDHDDKKDSVHVHSINATGSETLWQNRCEDLHAVPSETSVARDDLVNHSISGNLAESTEKKIHSARTAESPSNQKCSGVAVSSITVQSDASNMLNKALLEKIADEGNNGGSSGSGEDVIMELESVFPVKLDDKLDKPLKPSAEFVVSKPAENIDRVKLRFLSKCKSIRIPKEEIVFANNELQTMAEDLLWIDQVKTELTRSLIMSLGDAMSHMTDLREPETFSVWEVEQWTSSGCQITFLSGTLVLDIVFGNGLVDFKFCGKPAQEMKTFTLKSHLGSSMWPECELAHRVIHDLVDHSVLRLCRNTSQLDKVLHHLLVCIFKAEIVRKDITCLDPLHLGYGVEIKDRRLSVDFSNLKARVAFTVVCEIHHRRQMVLGLDWKVLPRGGHLREEDVLHQIRQVSPGLYYLGDVLCKLQKWIDAMGHHNTSGNSAVQKEQFLLVV